VPGVTDISSVHPRELLESFLKVADEVENESDDSGIVVDSDFENEDDNEAEAEAENEDEDEDETDDDDEMEFDANDEESDEEFESLGGDITSSEETGDED